MIRVFIGYEPRQPVAYQVAAHSIMTHAKHPVSITPLILKQLPITRRGLTDFTYSRYLVPWLSDFQGISVFLDSDILCRGNVAELVMHAYDVVGPDLEMKTPAVWMVCGARKYEWPSVMVFNNELCKNLTPEFVQDGRNSLFDLRWASSVGTLPAEWNHLVGYDEPDPNAKLVHFTKGIPIWPETSQCEFAEEWHNAFTAMLQSVSHEELMGRSVHVAR